VRAGAIVLQNSAHHRVRRPAKSRVRVTKWALIQEAVQGQQHLVPVLAITVPQVAELDQSIDFVFTQIERDASQSLAPASPRGAHTQSTGGDARVIGHRSFVIHL